MCLPWEFTDYDLLMNPGDVADGATLCDACIDEMDTIGIGHILDVVPSSPPSTFNLFRVSMLELDDASSIPYDVIVDFTSIKEASDSLDPPLSFDNMSEFITCYKCFRVFFCVITFSCDCITNTHRIGT